MLKKIIAILLGGILIMGLIACAGTGTADSNDSSELDASESESEGESSETEGDGAGNNSQEPPHAEEPPANNEPEMDTITSKTSGYGISVGYSDSDWKSMY